MNNITSGELLKQGTCALFIDGDFSGTAWLYDGENGCLLTAGHSFHGRSPQSITVKFLDDEPRPVQYVDSKFDQKEGIDFGILQLCDPLPKERIQLPVCLLTENQMEPLRGTSQFLLRGIGTDLNAASDATLEYIGTLNPGDVTETTMYRFHSAEATVKGLSGAPIYSEYYKAVVALQTEMDVEKHFVVAMPLFRVEGTALDHLTRLQRCAPPSPIPPGPILVVVILSFIIIIIGAVFWFSRDGELELIPADQLT